MDARKTALSILIAARKLITPRGKWIQHASGETAGGKPVQALHPDAIRFCSLGALRKVADDNEPARRAARNALGAEMKGDVLSFNDAEKRKKSEVIAAFDRAIAKLRIAQRKAA